MLIYSMLAGGRRTEESDPNVPSVIYVVGRSAPRENASLLGEYKRIRSFHGRPAYRKCGTRIVIRYWSNADRWLIDREGLQNSDICNAYAEQRGALLPCFEDLVWRVWESEHRSHVRDPEFLVTAVPPTLQVVGRATGKENWALNGEYKLVGLHQGRVAYCKGNSKHCIRYWAAGDSWLVDLEGLRDVDVCNAYADARDTPHPAAQMLKWYVWHSARGRHVADPYMQVVNSPRVVELVGRVHPKENACICGSYHIAGMHDGRPAYMKADGTRHAIRFCQRENRWLVDLEGVRDANVCNAYAEGHGGFDHPGDPALMWYVWETSRGRHLADIEVRTLVVPHSVTVAGRERYKENAGICGEYFLAAVVEGRPAYKKANSKHSIRYWPEEDRWLVDLESGLHGQDVANAYSDARGAEHPGCPDLVWHVWETSRGRHIMDEDVVVESVEVPVADYGRCSPSEVWAHEQEVRFAGDASETDMMSRGGG